MLLTPDDQGHFAMGLKFHEAINYVNSSFHQPASPSNVVLLIEARFYFDYRRHLFSELASFDKRFRYRGIFAGTIETYFDRQHLRIVSRCLDKLRNCCVRRVWMVK